MTKYVLGGGCFWCLDAVYAQLKGVSKVESGYAGGQGRPNYWRVVNGDTGHAEVVQVSFDETIIPSDIILDIFFLIHNPTSLNKQGADEGTQYRSTMMHADDEQKEAFRAARERAQKVWDKPIVTEVVPLDTFYIGETEHQEYYKKNTETGYCQIVIDPKINAAKQRYSKWFRDQSGK